MVVWTITNVEKWDPTQAKPRTVLTPPAGGSPMRDIPNWCWHEYGNRVGFWRLLQVYDEFKNPGVMNINGVAVNAFPDIVKACVERNWEFVGHGYTQRNMQKVENERADIRKCNEVLEKTTGKRPRGWLGPVCVPRTSSVLISRWNRLTSAHHDRAAMFRTGRLDRAIQVEEPA